MLYLCQVVHEDSGIELDESKRYLLEARLSPLARDRGLGGLEELCRRLQADRRGPLRQEVVEAMTTNETSFFRDMGPFEALRKTVIPELLQKRAPTRRLAIWCAACATGQEPYSLALLLHETVPDPAGWMIEILGTDMAESILERARRGRFSQLEVNRGLPAQQLVKYFRRDHMDWELKPEIRDMVKFRSLNLMGSFRDLGPFDLVLCRNVLIYFNGELKKKILAGIRGVLARDGYLLLGGSESVFSVDDHYERVAVGQASFYRMK